MLTASRTVPGRIAVIGAGMAGMACATTLAEAGIAVEAFEKNTTAGGRLSSRPVGGTVIDIGAQYATARGTAFRAVVDRMIETGAAAPWRPATRDIRLDDNEAIDRNDSWFVGRPEMSALVPALSLSGSLHNAWRVAKIARQPEGWFLTSATGEGAGPFAAVALTAPAPQTLEMIVGLDPVFETIADVGMSPCWTVASVFERPVHIDADVVRPSRGAFTWAARNGSKQDRDPATEGWVIHGDPVWSLDHLEASPEMVSRALLDAFAETTGVSLPPTVAVKVHRWRYARVENPVGRSHLLGCDGTLGAAGDWCIGARVEAAFDSGRALGQALADRLRAHHPEID